MIVGEKVDKLGYWIVGSHTFHEVALTCPSLRHLVARQFHPHTVNRVAGYGLYLSHHQLVAAIHSRGVIDSCVGILNDYHRVGLYHEIVVLIIVMGGSESHFLFVARSE